MSEPIRKKSPRAPSIALDEAIDRVSRVYDKEKRHPSNLDLVAKHLGYTGAKNGSAMGVMATLRYYGLLDRPKEGFLSVSKDFESYKFAPNDQLRREILLKWLTTPPIFLDLLGQYSEGLPSDANITFDLIQKGFTPTTAEAVTALFRRSVDYARYFEGRSTFNDTEESEDNDAEEAAPSLAVSKSGGKEEVRESMSASKPTLPSSIDHQVDRIPVRLMRGRKAWLEIPTPFYEADKTQLIAQINLLLTDDESNEEL